MIWRVTNLLSRVSMSIMGIDLFMRIEQDQSFRNELDHGRVFIQVNYVAPCSKAGVVQNWGGRKWYLSNHMTDDEIIKTAYAAFEACIKHEVMEGFKVDGKTLFNPHLNFEELLAISNREVARA